MQLLSIPPKSDIDLSRVNLNKVDEPLVNVVEFSNGKIIADMQYIKQGIPGAIQTPYLRKEVAERLVFASSMLPNGYKLKIYDGWRPYEVQKYLYDEYPQGEARRTVYGNGFLRRHEFADGICSCNVGL